jgi:hypothetical protein
MIFKGGTIRVLTPVTEDGNRPKLDAGGQRIWKEEYFPATAQRAFERRNNRLPDHLKKKIEPVSNGDIQEQPATTVSTVSTSTAVVKKRGPKPKAHA